MNYHTESTLYENVRKRLADRCIHAEEQLHWLQAQMDPYFAITMQAEIDAISLEINGHYARRFNFFQKRSQLCREPLYRQAISNHLPRILASEYPERSDNLPDKYQYAILAAEIASSLVYNGDREADFEEMFRGHLARNFSAKAVTAAAAAA